MITILTFFIQSFVDVIDVSVLQTRISKGQEFREIKLKIKIINHWLKKKKSENKRILDKVSLVDLVNEKDNADPYLLEFLMGN